MLEPTTRSGARARFLERLDDRRACAKPRAMPPESTSAQFGARVSAGVRGMSAAGADGGASLG